MLRQPGTKYYAIEQVTDSVYRTRNFAIIETLCNKARQRAKGSMVYGKFGLGRTTALTNYCLSHSDIFYIRLKQIINADLNSFLNELALSLNQNKRCSGIENLNLIVKKIAEKGIKLLIIDDFIFNNDLICVAALLCESLIGKTGVIFSCQATVKDWKNIYDNNLTLKKFFTEYISTSQGLFPPKDFEIRNISLDRGVKNWDQFKNCSTFFELTNMIDLYLEKRREIKTVQQQ